MPGRDIDSGWAWVVLVSSYMNLLLCSGLSIVAGMFQVVFLEQFQGSVALTSWITALFSSLLQLGGPVSSLVTNYANCRMSVMLGGALLSTGLVLSALADSLGLLFVAFGVMSGFGLGLTFSASVIIINYYFDKRRTMVTGIALSSGGLGIAIAPQISNILFQMFSWREALIVMGGVSAQICIFGALMFPVHENQKTRSFCRNILCCTDGKGNHDDVCNDCTACLQDNENDHTKVIGNGKQQQSTCSNLLTEEMFYTDENATDGGHESVELYNGSDVPIQNIDDQLKSSKEVISSHQKDSHHSCISLNERPATIDRFYLSKSLHHGYRHLSQTQSHDELFQNQHKRLIKGNNNSSQVKSQFELQKRPHADTEKLDICHLEFQKVLPVKTDILGSSQLILQNQLQTVDNLILSTQHTVVCHNQSLLSLVPSIRQLQVVSVGSNNSLRSKAKDVEYSNGTHLIPHAQNSQLSLWRNIPFWIFCAQIFLSNCGSGIFLIHLPSFCKYKGLTDQEMTNVLSIEGVGLLFGRMMIGFLANSTQLDVLLYWALYFAGGILVMLMPDVGTSYLSLFLITIGIGIYFGSVYSVLTSITITYVGLDNLATAFGVEMVCAGIGFLVAPPLAGLLVDVTGSYDYDMYCGGAILIVSACMTLLLPGFKPAHKITHPDINGGAQGDCNDSGNGQLDNKDERDHKPL